MKRRYIWAIVLLFPLANNANNEISDADLLQDQAETRYCYDSEDDEGCCNSLTIKDLCARRIKGRQGLFKELCTDTLKSKSICAENLGVTHAVAFNNVCANTISGVNLCLTGTARLNEVCGLYRASAQFAADTNYTLGNPVDFDVAIDDPNNNLSFAPFSYTVPVSGYYIASVQIDTRDIVGSDVILGTPVGNLQLRINGTERRQAFSPFLTFHNAQQTDLTFLLLLDAGDKVTASFDVLIVGPSGTTPYAGSSTLVGGDRRTIFKIHYLSSTCSPGLCPPCTVTPCETSCIALPSSCVPRD